jgi:NAD(P)-dependent dehydrogenase (short-subunit alcohol dehydrogenase family)
MTGTDLTGRVCLLTGAATGLARAMSHGLAEAGATVIAADVDAQGLEETAGLAEALGLKGRIVPQILDVSQGEQCQKAVARAERDFGRLDVLVNCAGLGPVYMRHDFISRPLPFWEADPERWWTMIAVNLRGPFLLSRCAAPGMIARGFGRIVNISTSFSTMIRGGNMPYGQTKAGLEAGTASWAEDLKGTGVTANVLIPGGAADTGMIPRDIVTDRSKLVSPDLMKPPVIWLASDASAEATGKRFVAQYFRPEDPLSAPGCAPAAWPELAAGASRGLGEEKKG